LLIVVCHIRPENLVLAEDGKALLPAHQGVVDELVLVAALEAYEAITRRYLHALRDLHIPQKYCSPEVLDRGLPR
jgi:hypothetical protein